MYFRGKKNYKETFALYMAKFKKRNKLRSYLMKNGIDVKIHYPIPLHLQKPSKALGYKRGDFPVAEKQALANTRTHRFSLCRSLVH